MTLFSRFAANGDFSDLEKEPTHSIEEAKYYELLLQRWGPEETDQQKKAYSKNNYSQSDYTENSCM